MPLLTLSEMANCFASAERRPTEDASLMLRQLRHLDAQGLIRADRVPRDGRGTAQFSPYETYLARLLLAAGDAGFTSGSLVTLASEIREGRRLAGPLEDGFADINLEANVRRMERGEVWLLECSRSREPETGMLRFGPLWVRRDTDGAINRFSRHYPDPMSPEIETLDGARIESVLLINATALLRPIIEAVNSRKG